MTRTLLMKLKESALFISILTLTACASFSPETPKFISPDKGKIVAIIVDASQFPTHTHFGTSLSREFVESLEFDWKIEEAIISTIRKQVEENTEFSVVNLRTLGIKNTKEADLVQSKKGGWTFHENKLEQVKKLQAHGVNLVVNISEQKTIASMYCPFESKDLCSPLYSEGYGLVTEPHLLGNTFYASASFATQIETLNPPSNLTKSGKFRGINSYLNTSRHLSPRDTPKAITRITEEELEPVKQEILKHFSNIGQRLAIYLNNNQKS